MKLSFSTLGCPLWNFDEVITTAKDLGLSGVEIRGLAKEIYTPKIKEFLPEHIDATMKKLAQMNVEIPILTSAAALADEENGDAAYNEACEYVDLAAKIGTKYIRVMGTNKPEPSYGNFKQASMLYSSLCEYAKKKNVTPLIETNGMLASSKEMLAFINMSGADNAGVLWDVHHTVRYYYENPEETAAALGELIRHVHVKDSVVKNGKIEYRMMGYGDISVLDCVKALKNQNYGGYISLEWLKRYNPELQEPGIVFAHFANYMTTLLGSQL